MKFKSWCLLQYCGDKSLIISSLGIKMGLHPLSLFLMIVNVLLNLNYPIQFKQFKSNCKDIFLFII